MKKSTLITLWGVLYIICAGLGFIPEPTGAVKTMLFLLSLVFFVPPALLLYRAKKDRDGKGRKFVRRVSLISLGCTLAALIGSILSALTATNNMGDVMHIVLGLVSAPMYCSNYWALSLFLWAAVLMASLKKEKA